MSKVDLGPQRSPLSGVGRDCDESVTAWRFAPSQAGTLRVASDPTPLDTPVRQLSLGQRMRCDLAAVLLHSPRILTDGTGVVWALRFPTSELVGYFDTVPDGTERQGKRTNIQGSTAQRGGAGGNGGIRFLDIGGGVAVTSGVSGGGASLRRGEPGAVRRKRAGRRR